MSAFDPLRALDREYYADAVQMVLLVVSWAAVLAWGLLAALGVAAVVLAFGLPSLGALCLYLIGLAASAWIGFRSTGRLSASRALLGEVFLLLAAIFIISGGLMLVWPAG